ncbi:hypothetical protein CR513_28081, partial [Mucuna pruriens]
MCWHAHGVRHDKSMITHVIDAMTWKQFDTTYAIFAQESQNVRLGLCKNSFILFCDLATPYLCWPVFVKSYNLPPSMCMRREYIFLSILIPRPKSPGISLYVYLRPLIEDLKILWEDGFVEYSWKTYLYCIEHNKSSMLKHGTKCCWFDYHHQYLPLEHSFCHDQYSFKNSTIERSLPPQQLNGIEIMSIVSQLKDFIFCMNSHNEKQHGFGEVHNSVKKSIFWELLYWSTNLIRQFRCHAC